MSMDTDLNGYISYIGINFILEFVAANMPEETYLKENRLREAFCILDVDKTDEVSQ
jgi:hypothetical protein